MSRTQPVTKSNKRTKVMPVRSTRKMMDTQDAESFGQDHPRVMKSTGPALEALEPAHIVTVDGPVNKEKMKAEKFNQDMLTVMVAQTTDPTDEPVPYVIVNGTRQNFIRGMEQQVKRMFVEKLLRAKKTSYTQRLVKDSQNNDTYVNDPHTVPATHVAIIYDPAGEKGRDWYNKIRQEA